MAFDSGFALPKDSLQTQGHPHVPIIKRMEIKSSCKSGYWMCKETFQASKHPAEIVYDIKANDFFSHLALLLQLQHWHYCTDVHLPSPFIEQ